MQKSFFLSGLFALAIGVTVLMLPRSGATQEICPDFPKVDFWGELTHDSVTQHVNQTLSGDWDAYLERLKRQHTSLTLIRGRGKVARVSRGGRRVVLKGAALSQYLSYSQERIAVLECLAARAKASGSAKAQITKDAQEPSQTESLDKKTFLSLPADLLEKLRAEAVRRSKKENRKFSVNDIIVETLKEQLKR
ncbi:MAG: hypothetical protein H8E39_06175 [Alphaproteobacteria bacterium]|nr:hypothetical protein [Alphaproteobacteria bacterium]